MKLTAALVFATGYVIGAKAGRERYAQIVEVAAKASQRLEEFSSSHPPTGQDHHAGRDDRRSRSQQTPR